jgi:hypothetical protein
MKLISAVAAPPRSSPCQAPAIANHGLSIGNKIAMT